MNNQVPTTIFSGFLGSGKTTIITNLIDQLQTAGQQVIYIKNEIGDEDVDTKILEGKGIKTKELLNGCICCTLVGPFINSVNEVIEQFSPDRIIIEASGAADPSALAMMVSSHPKIQRDGVIGIIDVLNFEGYKDLSITAQNQTKFIDLIIFNKVEEVDINQKRAVVGYVRELNTHSPIIEAPKGIISSDILFGINSKELDILLESKREEKSDHVHDDQIQTFNLEPSGSFKKEELKKLLNSTPQNIFRAKGFVKLEDDKYHVFNTVGNRTDFKEIDQNKISDNLLIFIGFMAHDSQELVTNSIDGIIIGYE